MIRTAITALALFASVPAFGQVDPLRNEPTIATIASAASPEIIANLRSEAAERVRAEADSGNPGAALSLARLLLSDVDIAAKEQGLTYLEQAADAGIVPAQVQLAGLLRTGAVGLLPDPLRARELLEEASATGDSAAMLALGSFSLDTELGKAGRDKAIALIQDAVKLGDINAANVLGGLYASGRGVSLDPQNALLYYEMGMIAGNSAAMSSMADLYRSGSGEVLADTTKAMALYVEAGSRGNQGAARKVADMYLRGEGVPTAPETAVALLQNLATGGDTQAYISLADYYLAGDVLPADSDRALSLFQEAVNAGNPSGLIRLGDAYRTGAAGVTADVRRAVEYYNRAVEMAAPGAERALGNLYLDLSQPVANPTRGIELLKAGAANGDANAAIRLGELYSINDVVQADYETSKSYFNLALSYGNANAMVDMARALVAGPLGSSHRDEAFALLTSAIESNLPGATTELAKLQLAGTFPGRGLEGVLTTLLESTRNGDASAARYLLQLYREGYGLVLAPDPAAAENLLATLEPVLGTEGIAVQRILLMGPDRVTVENLTAISEEFDKLGRVNGLQVLQQLRNSNAHAYVYIVQSHLSERGIYSGPLNGMLDSRTIGAMRTACDQVGASRICDVGPLTFGAVQVMGNFLFDQPRAAVESDELEEPVQADENDEVAAPAA